MTYFMDLMLILASVSGLALLIALIDEAIEVFTNND